MRDVKRIALFAAVGMVIAVMLALTGCANGHFVGFQATNCSGNKCVTTSVGPVSSSRAHESSPAPVQSSMAATPSIPGATAPAPDPVQAVFTCLGPDPSRDQLTALEEQGSNEQQDLVVCLHIPQDQVQAFYVIVARDAIASHDDFGSRGGRHEWASRALVSDAQQCHAGRAS